MNDSNKVNFSGADKLSALWEEYRYRHDLVWRILVTSAILVTTLSIIPYTSSEVAQAYKNWILLAPLGSLIAVILSAKVLEREVELMDAVYKKYDAISNELLEIDHKLQHGKSRFSTKVVLLLFLGLMISIGNAILIKWLWLPHLAECAS